MTVYGTHQNDLDRTTTKDVLGYVLHERERQDAKWGPVQDHPNIAPGASNWHYGIPTANQAKLTTDTRAQEGTVTYTDILLEEVAEAVEEAAAGNLDALRTELIQVAAVAVKWVENLDAK